MRARASLFRLLSALTEELVVDFIDWGPLLFLEFDHQ